MSDDQKSQNPITEPDAIEKLVAVGWIKLVGNAYVMTDAGRSALRRGFPGKSYGETLPVDAVRSRAKPSIKKNKHRTSA